MTPSHVFTEPKHHLCITSSISLINLSPYLLLSRVYQTDVFSATGKNTNKLQKQSMPSTIFWEKHLIPHKNM